MAKLAEDVEAESTHFRDKVYPVHASTRGPNVTYTALLVLAIILAIIYFQ